MEMSLLAIMEKSSAKRMQSIAERDGRLFWESRQSFGRTSSFPEHGAGRCPRLDTESAGTLGAVLVGLAAVQQKNALRERGS